MHIRSVNISLDDRDKEMDHDKYMKNFYNESVDEKRRPSFKQRKAMNQVQFDELYDYSKPDGENQMKRNFKKFLRHYYDPFTSLSAFKTFVLGVLPIIDWLPKYDWKRDLAADVIGGFTVGVMHVPQGIAYAILAKQPPINGLYTSLFGPMIYMLFGTSRHSSLGTFAVVSLMTSIAVDKVLDGGEQVTATASEVACTLCLTIGLILLVMALLRLQFLTTYMSDQVIAGFTTGASVHVLVSQLSGLLGIRGLPKRNGAFYLFMNLVDIATNIDRANFWCCAISIAAIVVLHVGKEYLNPMFKKATNCNVPLPFELLVVILSTIFVYATQIHITDNIKVVSQIPTDIPNVSLPNFNLIPTILPEAISITIVSVAVHLSISKMLAKKLSYELDAGQELFANSFASIGSCFFPVFPFSCSLSRTLVAVGAGVVTQLSILFSSILVLAVMLYFGQFLETLPMCALAAIIVFNLQGMLKKLIDLRDLWRVAKIDFSIWIVSFASTVIIDVSEGLIISVGFALFTTVLREQYPKWHLLASVQGTPDFRDAERYGETVYYKGICLFRFDAPLLFHNVECFKKAVDKAYFEWQKSHEFYVLREERGVILKPTMEEISDDGKECAIKDNQSIPKEEMLSRHFIVDCSGFTFIDLMGVSALKEVFSDMRKRGILVYFANAKAPVRELFEKCNFYQFVPKTNFYPTMRDATSIARERQLELGFKDTDYVPEHDRLTEVLSSHPM
ncbi:unnamed protein product [Caenorhabditis bovis]|uniref:STAS domain-containing protein n=1 Tax=Caenorhabditis bovis TaxID=2654633 RepID=A0A8S1EFN7_9PELO|nr:unnamed protein product [Caenorhabditis bovis]